MSDPNKTVPAPQTESQAAENQMRRALGLQGPNRQAPQQRADQARARHRFVQDGGVPVTVLNRSDIDPAGALKSRIAELEAALEAERAGHAAIKRALHDAQLATQALQTRLTHAGLAHREAMAAEQQARETLEAELRRLTPAKPAPTLRPVRRKAIASQRVPGAEEAQPVKWWLPGYGTKAK